MASAPKGGFGGSQIIDFDIPPGYLRKVSPAAARSRYIDGDKVRFWDGKPEKVGGFVKYIADQFLGIARGALAWMTNASVSYVSFGTEIRAYTVQDRLINITPWDASGTLGTNPLTTASGQSIVTVHSVAHGRIVGAHVIFSGASTVHGVNANGDWTVASVVDVDNFTFDSGQVASGSGAGGGAAVAYSYELNPGIIDTTYGLGWGAGVWGAQTWGTPRTGAIGILLEHRTWFFDRYGSELVGQPSGGFPYLWDEENGGDRLVVIANAPGGRASFVTNERMLVMLGTTSDPNGGSVFGPMTMAWSDQFDITNWVASLSSSADVRTLQDGNRLMAGSRFGNNISVFWSDTSFFIMQFKGSAGLVYNTPLVAKDCGLVGPTAFLITPQFVIWFGSHHRIFVYTGGVVQEAQNFGDIRQYIASRMDESRVDKMTFGHTPHFSEVWVRYVSIDSPDGEPDESFKVNYDDWTWSFDRAFGGVSRSAHVSFNTVGGAVIMMGADHYLYLHESGVDADGSPMPWQLKTGLVAINRNVDTDINGYIPDWDRMARTVTFTIEGQQWPNSQSLTTTYSFVLGTATSKQDLTMGVRLFSIAMGSDDLGSDFRLGIPLLDIIAPTGQTRGP